MQRDATSSVDALPDVPLREAARLYVVELGTLRNLVRRGAIPAYKARGPWGREWRVPPSALEARGYARRPAGEATVDVDARVARLERELAAARRAAAAERSRAEEADRRLGEALLQAGRLRSALAVAQAAPTADELPTEDVDELRDLLIDLRAARRPAAGDGGTARPVSVEIQPQRRPSPETVVRGDTRS